ncbi:uncharacterized protein IL334_002356 [Kwoniella shivajii]|uniref:S-adenosyl-L-methionine-dependent methyltransferase n=1 Tax=Kwoniella shivajii TaxID=564305 RepID=A0ABZ1CV58_9TREE|nr:hypothetical protein IL334_002356 [Kwoniella shivajii]
MPNFLLLALAIVPLAVLLAPRFVEPYKLWDPTVLNNVGQGERQTKWCNMGWWEDTDNFPTAAKTLGERLLDFAKEGGYQGGGNVLDIGHGAGESLLLHLSSPSPPKHLHGLTSLSSDTAQARLLIDKYAPDVPTPVELFTYSAQFNPTKDFDHPLNSMKGFMGEKSQVQETFAYSDEDDIDQVQGELNLDSDNPPPYNMIYILDAIYHFPPSLRTFLDSLKPVLSHDGLVVYTDIIPPPGFAIWKSWLISYILSVPLPNLTSRPEDLEGYRLELEKEGWKDIKVEDWSKNVWPGFAKNLIDRGGRWEKVGKAVQRVEKDGWKFIAVRIRKGD